MRKVNYIFCLMGLLTILSCTENNKDIQQGISNELCPCDSSGTFEKKGRKVTQCLMGNSLIEIEDISTNGTNDTLAVCSYHKIDGEWKMQEGIGVANDKILESDLTKYCDIKIEKNAFKIAIIVDQKAIFPSKKDFLFKDFIGLDAIIGKDTLHSKDTSILIPKEKFKGIIQIDKKMNSTYKGEDGIFIGQMRIEAENMIKYGNLLEQYKAINKYCTKNSDAKIKKEIAPAKKGPLANRE